MQRGFHSLVVLYFIVAAIVGMMSATIATLGEQAQAQDVTSLVTPPSFENQRFIIGTHPIPDPTQDGPPTFAISDIPDPGAFPTTTVRVHNYEGLSDDQRFWLSVRVREADAGVLVDPNTGYAEMGLIAPGGDADYTVTFPETGSAQVEFEVDGSTDDAAMLTILQFALESGLTAANVTGLGSHSQELGLALAEVVAEQYLADLPTLSPCANAVAAVQRGVNDLEQFTRDVQGCLKSPIWQVSVDQVLARVAERDWFQQSINLAGMAVPELGLALKAVEASQFAARVWTMYNNFRPEVPGAMMGTVAFMSVDATSQDALAAGTTVPDRSELEEVGQSGPSGQFVVDWSLPVTGHSQGLGGVVLGNTIFVGDEAGVVRAVDAMSGQVLWQAETGEGRQSVVESLDRALFVLDEGQGRLLSLDQATGALGWESSPGVRLLAAPDGLLFVNNYSEFHAIDASTGTELWRYPTDGMVAVPFVGRNSGVTAETVCNWVYCLDTANGQARWLPASASDELASVFGDTILVASIDGSLRALDQLSGVELWRTQFAAGQMPRYVKIADGDIAYGVCTAGFFALNTASGELRWSLDFLSTDQGSGLVGLSGGVLIGLAYTQNTSDGVSLIGVDANTGDELWRGPNVDLFSYFVARNAIYTSEDDGWVSRLDVLNGGTMSSLQAATGPFSILGVADGKVIGRSETDLIAIGGTGEPDPTPTPIRPSPGTTVTVVQVTVLRGAPSEQSVAIAELPSGTEAELREEAIASNGDRWWYVEIAGSGATGFIPESTFAPSS